MSDQQWSDWLSVAHGAACLGVSPSTVKRRIRDGQPVHLPGGVYVHIVGEVIDRPQGEAWRVKIPVRYLPPDSTEQDESDSIDEPPSSTEQWDVAAAITAATAPLVERIAALDERNERQAERIVELVERVGRAETERDMLRAQLAAAKAERQERPWWRFW